MITHLTTSLSYFKCITDLFVAVVEHDVLEAVVDNDDLALNEWDRSVLANAILETIFGNLKSNSRRVLKNNYNLKSKNNFMYFLQLLKFQEEVLF